MDSEQEMERKYLIRTERTFTDALDFMLKRTASSEAMVDDYIVKGAIRNRHRDYRYFDTFRGDLTSKGESACIGPLEEEGGSASFRERENDYVCTVKVATDNPEVRVEYSFNIPKGIEFEALDPNELARFWPPLGKLRERYGGRPLVEVIRLEVVNNWFYIHQNDHLIAHISLDKVKGNLPGPVGIERVCYELEIEIAKNGNQNNLETLSRFFQNAYQNLLVQSPLPKWIKALRIIRGDEIS